MVTEEDRGVITINLYPDDFRRGVSVWGGSGISSSGQLRRKRIMFSSKLHLKSTVDESHRFLCTFKKMIHVKMESFSKVPSPCSGGLQYYHNMVPNMNMEVIDPGNRQLQGQRCEVKACWNDAMWSAGERAAIKHESSPTNVLSQSLKDSLNK